jgi:hypothetical protein
MARHVSRSLTWAVVILLAAFSACADEIDVTGRWLGSNSDYTRVQLDLTELADSLSGSAQINPSAAGSSPISSPLIGTRGGEEVYVRGRLLPSVGGPAGFDVEFSGRLTIGGLLRGCLRIAGQPCSQISLHR